MQFSLPIVITVSALTLLTLGAIIFSLYIWHKSRHYTRERFTFVAFFAITSLITIAAISIFVGVVPWQILSSFLAHKYGFDYVPKETTLFEYGFFFLLFYLYIQFITNVHTNWKGSMTVEQYKRQQRQEPSYFVSDGLAEFGRMIKRLPPPEIYNPDDTSHLGSVLEGSKDTLVWREQALDLMMLSSKSYIFDKDEGWHDQEHCWIGRNKKSGDTIVLGCWHESPTDEQLQNLVNYARRIAKVSKNQRLQIIVAVKSGQNVETRKINGTQVEFKNEAHLLDNLVDFSDYITDIKDKVEKNPLTESSLTINDIYVPSAFEFEDKSKAKQDNIEDYLRNWLREGNQRQIALLGEYGQGKSTGSLMFTYHLLTQSNPLRIPILIELRGKSPRNMTLEEILAAWAVPYGIDPRALMKLLIAGRLLLILEGFDEMALIGDAETRLAHFKTLWQFCYPKSKILITGRPNFFLDDIERKNALGIQEPSLERPYCEAVHLLPFEVEKIEQSLRAVDSQTRQEIVQLAQQDEKFKEIASRPSLLYIVSTLWKEQKLSQYQGRMNSALVMGMFIKQSLARQTAKVQDHRDFMILNSGEREYFMLGIAAYMETYFLSNQITKLQLEEVVRLLLEVIPDSASAVDIMSREKSMPLRLRLSEDYEQAIENVKTDVHSCGLLVSDLSQSGAFKFAHKSFMEYLFASLVHNRLVKDKLPEKEVEITDTVWNALGIEVYPNSPELISFIAELLQNTISKSNENPTELRNRFVKESFDIIVLKSFKGYKFTNKIFSYLSIFGNVLFKSKIIPFSFLLVSLFFMLVISYFIVKFQYINYKLVVFTFLLYSFSYFTITGPDFEFELWYQCCKALKIEDEEMAKVVGKWAMPVFKKKYEQD